MKLQKHLSKKRGDKVYHKYVIVIPEDKIRKAELRVGDDLEVKSEKHKLIINKIKKSC